MTWYVGNREMLHVASQKKFNLILLKYFSRTANGRIRITQGHVLLGVIHFWGIGVSISLYAGKR